MRRGNGTGTGTVGSALLGALCALAALWLSAAPAAAQEQQAVRGGNVLYGDHGGACTVGFNARSGGGTRYGILSGSCAEGAVNWYADPARTVLVGISAGGGFPGPALVRYTNDAVSYPGEVDLGGGSYLDITGAANPHVGQQVCHADSVSGLHCGVVQAVNVTVQFPQGTVYGLFRATDCAVPGDAGAPSFDGTTALGLVLGGTGSCATGGSTYHQPVTEVLSRYGLVLY